MCLCITAMTSLAARCRSGVAACCSVAVPRGVVYLPGTPHQHTLRPTQAVESTNTIVEGLPSADIVTHVLPVIERLASGEWFTSRVSAAGLFPTAYARLADPAAATKLRQCVASCRAKPLLQLPRTCPRPFLLVQALQGSLLR